MRRRVTFSRNYTLSLSRTCRCYCKYCSFATHKAHLYSPDEVEQQLDLAVRRRAKELLVLTGEKPEVDAGVDARGWPSTGTRTSRPTSSGPASARSSAACCRTRTSACSTASDLARAARGDRLAGADARVDQRAADGDGPRRLADQAPGASAGDDPRRRRAEDPVHERDPRRASARRRDERIASLEALADVACRVRAHPGGHPPELRPARALLRPRARRRSPTRRRAATGRRASASSRSCRCRTGPAR